MAGFSKFLYEGVGLNKNTIGDFLGENKPFSILINKAFFTHFDFSNLVIDQALRNIFKKIRLPKEFL